MDRGAAKFQGKDVSKAIDLYYTRFSNNDSNVVYTDNSLELEGIEILNATQFEGISLIKWGDDFNLKIKLKLLKEIDESLKIDIIIFDKEQRPVALIRDFNYDYSSIVKNDMLSFNMVHNKIQLSKGVYILNISVTNSSGPVYRANSIYEFQVTHDHEVWQPFLLDTKVIV
jgi:lipopolysaccharide transport system ATP-binding protein